MTAVSIERYSHSIKKSKVYRGFTLIELLIVLVIIGVVLAASNLMFSNHNSSNLKSAINLFQGRILLAKQEAILTNATLGIAISTQGYSFYRYIENDKHQWSWDLIPQDRALNYHPWPHNGEVSLQLSQNSSLGSLLPSNPQIILYPSGQMTPFRLTLNNKFQIMGQANGQIMLGTL